MTDLIRDLRAATAHDVVLDHLAERAQWANDASMYSLLPRAVVIARHAEDVRAVLAVAAQHSVPVCFRAGGTSLSGQAVSDGILIVVSRHLRRISVQDDGLSVTCEPGAVGAWVNAALAAHGRRIGPDPASMQAAEIGGIVANNASGMCCGVQDNSYRTVTGLDLILADGFRIDTAAPDADDYLLCERPRLAQGLKELAIALRAQPALSAQVTKAFTTKNTVGYSLNALLDAHTPAAMLQKLVVGSEGTLAFIASATFRTLPLPRHRSTAWLLFRDVEEAGRAVEPLSRLGVAAVELLDAVALRRVADKLPDPLPAGEPAALLVEFQTTDPFALGDLVAAAGPVLAEFDLAAPAAFTSDPTRQALYWNIRKGLFPSVGAIRSAGTAVIIEDVTFPVAGLADGVRALRACFHRFHYDDAVIFGHAKDGNLHFTLTPDFSDKKQVDRYRQFMEAMTTLVLDRGGHLKAEHGTGRNMAPFVVRQWGLEAVTFMRQIKYLLDPQNILNPGVLLSDDPEIHIKHLKRIPSVDPLIDRCIECGFCEPVCPSRDVTMSPRQRIVALRATRMNPDLAQAVRARWQHDVLDTCAADGTCASACPVHINTGDLVKAERAARTSSIARAAASIAQRHISILSASVRGLLSVAEIAGIRHLPGRGLSHSVRSVPLPRPASPLPRHWPRAEPGAPTMVYLPTCLARTVGAEPLPLFLSRLCAAAGIGLVIPDHASGLCCGQPFASKGFIAAHLAAVTDTAQAIIDAAGRMDNRGIGTLVTDTSTCSAHLAEYEHLLSEPLRGQWRNISSYHPAQFVTHVLIPRLRARGRLRAMSATTAIHPTCSEQTHGWSSHVSAAVAATGCSGAIPSSVACCGMAGDLGWRQPAITAAATAREAADVKNSDATLGITTSATCGMAMSAATNIPYHHLFTWLHAALIDDPRT